MKIETMSDTHGLHNLVKLKGADVLIHSGDFMNYGTKKQEALSFFAWFTKQPHEHKILVAGNHDILMERDRENMLLNLPSNITYLEDSGCIIDGIKFWGSPVTPDFSVGWAFNRHIGEDIKKHWDKIPDDTNVVITHTPMAGILDFTNYDERVGCYDLRDRLEELEGLKMHTCGHIHPSYGRRYIGDIKFLNSACCNMDYRPVNQPHLISL